jgi:hypothetical protein
MEKWLPISGFPSYEVSDLGRVRSIDRIGNHPLTGVYARRGRVLTTSRNKHGHHQVMLYLDGKCYPRWVHRLVYEAFNGPIPDGQQVRHWPDRDPSNNTPNNLGVGTALDDAADRTAHGTHRNTRKTECIYGHAFTPENTVMDRGRRVCVTCKRRRQRNPLTT